MFLRIYELYVPAVSLYDSRSDSSVARYEKLYVQSASLYDLGQLLHVLSFCGNPNRRIAT